MSTHWLPLALLGTWGIMAVTATAGDDPSHASPACCDKTIRSTDVVIFPREEACTEAQLNIREVVTKVPTTSFTVDFKEEKRTVTIMVPKPHEIERLIQSTTWVPEQKIDPCTGHCYTTYKEVPYCKVEKVQVYEPVPECREVTVRVPVLKPVQREIAVKELTADWSTKPTMYTRLDMVVIPKEIKLPALPCLPPPPPTDCPRPCCKGTTGSSGQAMPH